MDEPLTIRLTPHLRRALSERGEPPYGLVIERDLQRYYEALRHARERLRARLRRAELSLLLDVLNGT